MNGFLKANGRRIVDERGWPVVLKGVNFGGWLMTEAYLLHAPNRPEKQFREEFAGVLGAAAMDDFDQSFRRHFIREEDIRRIRDWGFNCIRVPFHHRVVESAPFQFKAKGLLFLDAVIRWAERCKVWIILDLHAAPGSQNHDWHSDSAGRAGLWLKKIDQERTFAIWEFLAERYKDKTCVAGYDLLNEPVLEDTRLLNDFYKKAAAKIRSVDKNHILFVEGNKWATDVECLEEINDDNHALSIHSYEPLEFTFNFVPHLTYPYRGRKRICHKGLLKKHLSRYERISRRRGVPIYAGEFGVHARNGFFGEDLWLKDMLGCFEEFGFHWTYWTYKAVKNSMFPDGIFSYYENPQWVNRQGPVSGWDTYKSCWGLYKKEMIRSWHTDQFRANTGILNALKDAVR